MDTNPQNLGNNILTKDQRQRAGELSDQVLERVFTRISSVLTDEDMMEIEEIDAQDHNGEALKYFLISKVPNFEAILEEELKRLSSS